MKFHNKKERKGNILFSCFFDELHGSLFFVYEPSGIYFSRSTFLLHQEGTKNHKKKIGTFSRGWNPLPGACADLDLEAVLIFSATFVEIFESLFYKICICV